MKDEIIEIPDEFWAVYQSVRIDQLLQFAWEGKDAREFAESEIVVRKNNR